MLKSGKLRNVLIWQFCGLLGFFCLCNLEVQAQPPGSRGGDRGGDRGRDDRGSGMTSERVFGYMDRNKNGVLDPEETSRMPSHIKEQWEKSGIDLSRGVEQKQFGKAFEQMRKVREKEEQKRREDYEKKKREESGGSEEKRESTPARKPVITIKPHERVTVDIPSKFEEGDLDQDGQVAFYEWRKWKRTETDSFFTYDHNGDGFLTPKELGKGPSEAALTALEAVKSLPTTSSVVTNPVVKTVSVSKSTAPVDMDSAEARRGKSMFRLLDKDRSGNVTPDEWKNSSKLQPMFAKGGVDLSKPMDENTFITQYVKLSATDS